MLHGMRRPRLAAMTVGALMVATACGTSDSGTAAPSSPAPTTTAARASVPAPKRDQSWAGIDPCGLLPAARLRPFLADTPVTPSRADAGGKHVCAWGDGEFRSVRLSVWQPASAAELTRGALRQVPVGGRTAEVLRDAEYTCELQVGDQRLAVNLSTVSADKIKLCADTTAALAAVVARLPS